MTSTALSTVLEPSLIPKLAQTLDYGLIGNGQINALISGHGSIDWACMPAFDSPTVFGEMLGPGVGGMFRIEPVGTFGCTQTYLRNTVILETHFHTQKGDYNLLDFIPRYAQMEDTFKPPQIHRLVELRECDSPEVKITYTPQLNYGRGETRMFIAEGALIAEQGEERVYLYSNIDYNAILAGDTVVLTQGSYFLVSYDQPLQNVNYAVVLDAFRRTTNYWRGWVKHCYLPNSHQAEIIRSALTLKMLVYEDTGAVIAAPTTSIPEIFGGNRTWDYRFCWLRDSYFIVDALMKLSQFEELEGFTGYLKNLLGAKLDDESQLDYIRPLYTIHGTPVPEEIFLENWSGFNNSQPVRIGNNATTHFQNDIYGELVQALVPLFFDQRIVREDIDQLWLIIKRLVELAVEKFPEEDNGIWEFRNARRHYTFSKLMCWVAVDRGVRIAQHLGKLNDVERWGKLRTEMHNEILTRAWNPELGAFTQSYGCGYLDASTLLMPVYGFLPATEPRMKSTITLSEQFLMKNGFAFRYTNEDDFGKPENAFTICTFWMIDALALAGETEKALYYFNNLLKYANPLGLFSEDINPKTGALTGNFPQGYTHVAIINTAMRLNNHNFYVH